MTNQSTAEGPGSATASEVATSSPAQASLAAISESADVRRNAGGAGATLPALKPGFRRCYNAALEKDPSITGSVELTAKIGPAGEVTSVVPSEGGGLPDEVKQCLADVVTRSRFGAPEGGGTIVIPVTLTPM